MRLDVLAFGAHPDDVELYASGTLARLATQGYATGIADLTRGELGSRGTPAERTTEAKEAAQILRLRARENLGMRDGEIRNDSESRFKVIRVLRKYRPPLILVHHWEDRHPDHAHTGLLVTEAAHHSGLAKIKTGQERFRPNTIAYFGLPGHVLPSLVVDVSDFAEQRFSAIQAYRSQLFDPASHEPVTYLSQPDFLTYLENIHSFYGTLIGRAKGEGFFVKGALEVGDLVALAKCQGGNRIR